MLLTLAAAVARQVLTVGGTSIAANGLASSTDVQTAIGALTVVVSTAWSIYQKYKAKRATEVAAATGGVTK